MEKNIQNLFNSEELPKKSDLKTSSLGTLTTINWSGEYFFFHAAVSTFKNYHPLGVCLVDNIFC